MKKLVLFAFAILCYGVSISQTFTVDGLDYEVTSTNPNEVSITGGTPPTSDLQIPETVTDASITYTVVAIANGAFESAGLTSVSFPSSLRQLGEVSFRFNFLTSVTIPAGITTIPQRCFSSNDLTSVVLPTSLETIGFRAFENNEFTSLTLPENVTAIAQLAFRNAPLNTINSLNTLPPSVVLGTSNDSFNNEQNIDLTVPDGTETAYEAAGWTGFRSVNGVINFEVGDTFTENNLNYTVTSVSPNKLTITGGTTVPQNLIIPENVSNGGSDFVVTAIGNTAFREKGLTSLSIPNTIITIGFQAFRINQLTSVVIPENVTTVSAKAFLQNPLTSVTVQATNPPSVNSDPNTSNNGNNSFSNRGSIDLTIPVGTQLEYLNNGWTGFATINGELPLDIGNTLEDNGLSYRITALNPTEVEATGGTNIPANLVLPETITSQGIVFTVVGIGDDAFPSSGLTSVTFPNTIRSIGNQAFRTNALTSVVIPEGVVDLPNRCFSSNDLTSVALPTSLETIGFRAFENNEFTSLTLPENVTAIAQLAFSNAPLNAISSLNTLPPSVVLGTSNDSFNNEPNIDLTVPPGAEDAYLAAGWTGFASVNGEIPIVIGSTFTVNGLDYTITSLVPNEVDATGGDTIPTNLVIPESVIFQDVVFTVVSIGTRAFEDKGLTTVTFPSTLRALGEIAFRLNALTEVTIPEGITSIPQRCFSSNDLTSVVLPTSLETIGFRSFESNNLTSLLLPENVVSISQRAFTGSNFNSINSLNPTPPSVVLGTTGSDSFGNEANIDLTIPTGTEAAYEAAGWVGFKSVNGVVDFEVGDTFTVNNLSYIITSVSPNEVTVTGGGTTIPQDLIIPENVSNGGLDFVVTAIGDSAFITSSLTSVTFPNTLRIIGDQAFRNSELTALTIPSGVTGIGSRAFQGNQIAGDVVIPNSITDLSIGVFRDNNIASVSISENLTAISNDLFRNNNLTTVTIPAGITSIGDNSFRDNPLIEVIAEGTIPPSIVNGGSIDSFLGNRPNIDLIIPTGTEAAYEAAGWVGFKSVNGVVDFEVGDTFTLNNLSYIITSLSPNEVTVTGGGTAIPQDLIIPENVSSGASDFVVTGIGDDAFIASSVTSVMLPNTIRTIGNSAFRDNDLTTLNIPDSVTFIDRNAFNGNQLANVTIPNSVSTINNGAFNNNQLTSVVIPNSVTTLTIFAFANNQLTSITLGNSVSTLERDVFVNNPLATVTVLATEPPTTDSSVDDNSFGNRSGIDLFVPEDSVTAYINSGQWNGFNSITGITIDITVAPKVFLQGASLNPITGEEDLMRDSLRENGLLPTTSPYGDGATVNPTVFTTTGTNAIVDWVLVELRTGVDSDNTTVVNSKSALLQRDGDIIGIDGTSEITFTEEEGDYFIAIIHRNHIGILAAVPTSLSNTATALDFTQDITSAKGENLALTTLVNGTFAMIAGDADGSSQILNTDITEGLTLAGGGEGYSSADADMNGFVLNSDIQLLILGNSGTVQQFD